jgi:hypothetical protein
MRPGFCRWSLPLLVVLVVFDFGHAHGGIHEVCPPVGLSGCQVVRKPDGGIVVLGEVFWGHFGFRGKQRSRMIPVIRERVWPNRVRRVLSYNVYQLTGSVDLYAQLMRAM